MSISTPSELTPFLENSARDALETMCFYGVLGRSAVAESAVEDVLAVGLTFHGDAQGIFAMQISAGALTEIATNFLGEDMSELAPGESEAVGCELANMVCGAALSQWQPDGHFELSQPEARPPDTPPLFREPTVYLDLELETGRLSMSMWID